MCFSHPLSCFLVIPTIIHTAPWFLPICRAQLKMHLLTGILLFVTTCDDYENVILTCNSKTARGSHVCAHQLLFLQFVLF